MSQKINDIVKERLAGREDEDEERMVLESAMAIMDAGSPDTNEELSASGHSSS
jgi:hypothetical protein